MSVRKQNKTVHFKDLNYQTDNAEISFKVVVVSIFMKSLCPLTQDYFELG